MKKSRVALIGPYPPPIGGISVHVHRLASLLAAKYEVIVVDPYRERIDGLDQCVIGCGPLGPGAVAKSVSIVRKKSAEIVHIHVSSMHQFAYGGHVLVSMLPRSARRILTIHSGSFVPDYEAANVLTRALIASLVRRFDLVIAVSAEIEEKLKCCGVPAERICVLPAFIPQESDQVIDGSPYLQPLRQGNRKVIVSSGYAIREYGFEVLLGVLAECEELGAGYSVALCLYNTYDDDYLRELEALIEKVSCVRVFRDLSPAEFSAVLSSADLYVRATRRDGDAVAIREAAHYGKPVLASDCVVRPTGCRIFHTDDHGSLGEALRAELHAPPVGVEAQGDDTKMRYLNLYQRCRGQGSAST